LGVATVTASHLFPCEVLLIRRLSFARLAYPWKYAFSSVLNRESVPFRRVDILATLSTPLPPSQVFAMVLQPCASDQVVFDEPPAGLGVVSLFHVPSSLRFSLPGSASFDMGPGDRDTLRPTPKPVDLRAPVKTRSGKVRSP